MCRSSIPKVNRRSVRRAIQLGVITGRDLNHCAIAVQAQLGVHPATHRKVIETLEKLMNQDEIVLHDAKLRLTTEKERESLQRARKDERHSRQRIAARTAAKRSGGIKSLQLA